MPGWDSGNLLSVRLPPSNVAAEQALLGALLANNKAYDRVSEFLKPKHFADPINGRIYESISRRVDAGQLADAITLNAEFENAGILEEVGGTAYLTQLLTAMVGIINAGDYGRAILDTWMRREVINLGEELVTGCYVADGPVSTLASSIVAKLDEICVGLDVRKGTPLAEAMEMALERGRLAAERTKREADGLSVEDAPIKTGLPSLDERLGELEGGGVYIIGAQPGDGKSAIALQIAIYNALRRVPVHLSSTEMEAAQLGRRALSHLTGVPAKVIKAGAWTDSQQRWLGDAAIDVSRVREFFLIEDSPGLNTRVIGAQARAFVRKFPKKKGLIVIDHMHDLSEFSESDMIRAVGTICNGVKLIAKQTRWPVILLAQLSRNADRRESKRPEMGDLYGGRKIEAIAEAILLLHRPDRIFDPFPPERKSGEQDATFLKRNQDWQAAWDRWRDVVQGFVVKLRDGMPGIETWKFDGASNRFTDHRMPNDQTGGQ